MHLQSDRSASHRDHVRVVRTLGSELRERRRPGYHGRRELPIDHRRLRQLHVDHGRLRQLHVDHGRLHSSSSTSTDPETGNGTVEIPEPPASFRVSPPQSNDEVDAAAQGLIARLAEPSVQSFAGAPAPSARTEALLELHALLGFPVFTDGGGRLITEGFEGEGIETFWWEVWYLAAGPHGGMTTLADVADYLAISAAAPNDLQGEDSFALRYALLRDLRAAEASTVPRVRILGKLVL